MGSTEAEDVGEGSEGRGFWFSQPLQYSSRD